MNNLQRQMLYDFNRSAIRAKFNPELFRRSDDDLIDALRDIIYSCERTGAFTIKVLGFEIIDNYDDINHILWEYEDFIINKGKKKLESSTSTKKPPKAGKRENQYAYINLEKSALKLVKVTYYIEIVEKKNGLVNDTLTVYIAIPRVVDDFYYLLNGKTYSAMYQVVDASTYNNSAARNAKKQSITFRTIFSPLRVYRNSITIKDVQNNQIQCKFFVANIFTKPNVLLLKYILAKTGLDNCIKFLKLDGIRIAKSYEDVNLYDYYVFPVRDMYVIVSKIFYDSVQIMQSLVFTLMQTATYNKGATVEDFYDNTFWLRILGAEFITSKDADAVILYEKGVSILGSLEFTYDKHTQNDLMLSDEDKGSIYRVLRWMMYEFNALRNKDNLDISTKKVRTNYTATMYATKLAFGIYRISDKGDKADLNTIRKALQTPPMYLINAITSRCGGLVSTTNCVNDLDALAKLKYTVKGVSGIGEKSNAISMAYRCVHPSHLGRVDIDTSSNSDPGVSGALCPFANLYHSHFSEYEEPSTWEDSIEKVMEAYNRMLSRIEMCRLVQDSGSNINTDNSVLQECISITKDILRRPLFELNNGIQMCEYVDEMTYYI